jgi:glutaminase
MFRVNTVIRSIYNDLLHMNIGNVATYIPELANIDPDLFGISVCDIHGNMYNIGDHKHPFGLQSCSKPLSYCIAYDQYGKRVLHKHVGYEPSGKTFNAFVLNQDGIPHNPMINAGAIMIATQLRKREDPATRFNLLQSVYSQFAGNRRVGFDNSMFLSEKYIADGNIALAYYMRENSKLNKSISHHDIMEGLDLYYQQCSTTITCEMGAIISATLANKGICPTTNRQVVSENAIKDCLTLLRGCGLYNYSGKFAFEVGLPAKSGISGCIFLIVPNVMGICVWSPPLDDNGNSSKGIEFCKRLNEELDLHMFHNT